MQRIIILFVVLLLGASVFSADFKDSDGILGLVWTPPNTSGTNPLKGIIINYDINGVVDSITTFVPIGSNRDSSVVLTNIGDFAYARLRAVSIVGDTSSVVVTDRALFALPTGIDPPTAPTWE